MSLQEPVPYSSVFKHGGKVLFLYPKHIRQIWLMMNRQLLAPLFPEDLRKLILGNYMNSSYRNWEAHDATLFMRVHDMCISYIDYSSGADFAPYGTALLARLKQELPGWIDGGLRRDAMSLNSRNYLTYSTKKQDAMFLACMQRARRLDSLGHKFITGFFAFEAYASPTDRLLAIEYAINTARRLDPLAGGGACDTPEYACYVCDLRVVVAYYDSRRTVDPWDTPQPAAGDLNLTGQVTMEDYAGFGREFLRVGGRHWGFKPELRNILLEMEPLIRTGLAVAFASVTHKRGHALFGLEAAIVKRIFELADYYA